MMKEGDRISTLFGDMFVDWVCGDEENVDDPLATIGLSGNGFTWTGTIREAKDLERQYREDIASLRNDYKWLTKQFVDATCELRQLSNDHEAAKQYIRQLEAQLAHKDRELEAQVTELMEPKTISEDNPWSMRENGHYGLDLFYGEVGIAHMSEKAYAQLVEYMSSTVTNNAQAKSKEVE